MKVLYYSFTVIVLVIILLFSSCYNCKKRKLLNNEHTSIDSIWLQFAKAMDSNDVEFLINNSLDTISLAEFDMQAGGQKENYESKFIFQNHLNKVMHLKTLSNQKFSSYQVDTNLIRVVYNIKAHQAPEGSYGLVFTLIKKEGKYLFQGMLVQ